MLLDFRFHSVRVRAAAAAAQVPSQYIHIKPYIHYTSVPDTRHSLQVRIIWRIPVLLVCAAQRPILVDEALVLELTGAPVASQRNMRPPVDGGHDVHRAILPGRQGALTVSAWAG